MATKEIYEGKWIRPEWTCARASDVPKRVEELPSGKRVLLPKLCQGETGNYTTAMLRRVIAHDSCSVLITGESGTGKEALWDCIRERSKRAKEKIKAINCTGLGGDLAESELFGHKEGAFTGSTRKREGLVKSCEHGILFLDEIGWMPEAAQAKLLRFMETGEFRQVGSDDVERAHNVRIVAATNGDVKKKEIMLPDLLHRFDHQITLPPLRARDADALWFVSEKGFLGDQTAYTGISLRTLIGVLCAPWDGNVRALAKFCKWHVMFHGLSDLQPEATPSGTNSHCLEYCWLAERHGLPIWELKAKELLLTAIHMDSYNGFLADGDIRRTLGLLDAIKRGSRRDESLNQRDTDNQYSEGLVFQIQRLQEILFEPRQVPIGYIGKGRKIIHLLDDPQVWAGGSDCVADLASFLIFIRELWKPEYSDSEDITSSYIEEIPVTSFPKGWIEKLRMFPEVKALQECIPAPGDQDFETRLQAAELDDLTKKVCRYCHDGLSTRKIAAILKPNGPKVAKVKDIVRRVRGDFPEIGAMLPVAKSGRPKREQ